MRDARCRRNASSMWSFGSLRQPGAAKGSRKPNSFFVCKAGLWPRVYTVNKQTLRGTSAAGAGAAACCYAGKGDQRRRLSFPPGGAGLPTKANRFGPAHVSRWHTGGWPGYPAPLPSSPSLSDFGQTATGWRTHLAARRVAVCLMDPLLAFTLYFFFGCRLLTLGVLFALEIWAHGVEPWPLPPPWPPWPP